MNQIFYRVPCLVLSLLCVAIVPRDAAAAVVATQPATKKSLDVQVEVKLGEADEQKLAASVREAVVDRVRAREIEITDDAPASLVVTIGWQGKSRQDLAVKWILQRRGGEPETLKTSVCAACGSREVVATIDGDLEPLWARIDTAATVANEPVTTAPTTAPPASVPVGEAKDRKGKRRSIGALGLSGIAIGALGIGALAAGAVMWRVEYRYPENDPDIRKNLKKPGIGLVAGGAALAVAGIVMAAIDLSSGLARGKRDKQVAFAPSFDRRHFGVALAVRW